MAEFVFFEEELEPATSTCDIYEYYGLEKPTLDLIPGEKTRQKLHKYLLEPGEDVKTIRKKSIVMYLHISPVVRGGESIAQALYRAALETTAEETTGTWDPELKTIAPGAMDSDSERNMGVLQGKVIGINARNGMVACALPVEGFEPGSLPQLASVIIGNYTGMTSQVNAVRFEDVEIPDEYADTFPGPALGPSGIWKRLGVEPDTPLMGTIIKPKTGLSAGDWAKYADLAFRGGLDVVKDDENLTDQDYCRFKARAGLVLENLEKMERDTGRKAIYVPNVTAATIDDMLERAKFIKEHGGLCLMIDLLAAGWTALQTLRREFPDMIIHGHRAGHGTMTVVPTITVNGVKRTVRHGLSMKILALFARLGGVDQLHIGAPLGKMEAHNRTCIENLEMITRPMGKIKPCLAINSGGLSPDKFQGVVKLMAPPGTEKNFAVVFQAGGGTHAHPLGTFGGAKAMIQARRVAVEGIPLFEALNRFYELRLAYRRWQRGTYDDWLKSLERDTMVVVSPDARDHAVAGKVNGKPPEAVPLVEALSKDDCRELLEDVKAVKPELVL
ncbi:MAG: RuBisCO large subunit C-terminal-like domain-containing protein [Promethearchaeota archaeon]